MKYPIILYHGVTSEKYPYKFKLEDELEWVINIEAFQRQMDMLKLMKYNVVTLAQTNELRKNNRYINNLIILTFDDGHESNYYNVFPVLLKNNIKAEFFVTSEWIGSNGYMTEKQLIEMHNAGMSIQSHGLSHKFLTNLEDEVLEKEIKESKNKIKNIIGKEIDYISYPGGRYSDITEICVLKFGYKGSLVSDRGYNDFNGSMYRLKRLWITRDTSDLEFKAIVSNDFYYHSMKNFKYILLLCIRKIFGSNFIDILNNYRRAK